MAGRTISKIEFGFRHDIKGVHQSELLLIYFTDGAVMGIDTGSNAANLRDKPASPKISM